MLKPFHNQKKQDGTKKQHKTGITKINKGLTKKQTNKK